MHDNDDWDYTVPTVSSWDYDVDPIELSRADPIISKTSLAASMLQSVKQSIESTGRDWKQAEWSADRVMCGTGMAGTRCVMPTAECREANNSLFSDATYYATTAATPFQCGREDHGGFAREEQEDSSVVVTPPMRHKKQSQQQPQLVVDFLPDLAQRDDFVCEDTTVSSDSSGLPPPPPPPLRLRRSFGRINRHDVEIRAIVSELRREIDTVNKYTQQQQQQDTPTCSTDSKTTDKNRLVQFAHPVVTSLKHRPISTQQEKKDLYFTWEELTELAKDRGDDFDAVMEDIDDNNDGVNEDDFVDAMANGDLTVDDDDDEIDQEVPDDETDDMQQSDGDVLQQDESITSLHHEPSWEAIR